MAIVTGIEIVRGRVIVRADGSEIARVPKAHFEQCRLHEGDEIDPERWLDQLCAVQRADAYEAALTSLDYCARSAKELASALRRKGFVEPVIALTTQRLQKSGLIDDARYALRMAEITSEKPVGVYAFKRKLLAKGISEEDAASALSAFDDEQQRAACAEAAQKLLRKYEGLPPRERRARLSQAISRRGFGWDAIDSALEQLPEP